MKYEHIVYVSQSDQKQMLRVDRLLRNGQRVFMTEFEIKPMSELRDENTLWDEFEKLGAGLGKSICIDIEMLRLIMGIDNQ